MTFRIRTTPTRLMVAAVTTCLLLASSGSAGILFSYDASSGQFPTEQGWKAFEVDTEGPLTEPNTTGTSADYANAAMETFPGDGLGILHIRDTLTDDNANLPNFYYEWTPQQQNALMNYGLKLTVVLRGIAANTSGKGNIRIDMDGSSFESFDNIGPDRMVQVQGLSAELVKPDEDLHTVVITGEKSGANDFVFNATYDGDPLTGGVFGNVITSPSLPDLINSVYFGASSSGGNGTDILVRSVVMETLNVPEPGAAALLVFAFAALATTRRSV